MTQPLFLLIGPFFSKGRMFVHSSCGVKRHKGITSQSWYSCGALSCWGQQVGFLPSRDGVFYNEKVKEIIMEINSWTAVACELGQAELLNIKGSAAMQNRSRKPLPSSLLGSVFLHSPKQPYLVSVCISACICQVWFGVSEHAWQLYSWPINQPSLLS